MTDSLEYEEEVPAVPGSAKKLSANPTTNFSEAFVREDYILSSTSAQHWLEFRELRGSVEVIQYVESFAVEFYSDDSGGVCGTRNYNQTCNPIDP